MLKGRRAVGALFAFDLFANPALDILRILGDLDPLILVGSIEEALHALALLGLYDLRQHLCGSLRLCCRIVTDIVVQVKKENLFIAPGAQHGGYPEGIALIPVQHAE